MILTSFSENDATLVLDNDGDASFSDARLLIDNQPSFSETHRLIDIDNDGDDDLLFSDSSTDQTCVVEIENGESLGLQIVQRIGKNNFSPDTVDLVDVDNDQDLDLVFVEPQVSVFFNTGNGAFSLPQSTDFGTGNTESLFGDIDNDSDTDIVVLNQTAQQISILTNNGNGTFIQGPVIDLPGNDANGLGIADLNNDSDLDIVVLIDDF